MKNEIRVKIKRQIREVPCQGCGKPVSIIVPYVGDILCGNCMKPSTYTVEYDDSELYK